MDKQAALTELARKRQEARWPGYTNLNDYYDGAYECLHVSPYTKSAANIESPIMVFLQDWTSDESIRRGLNPDIVALGYTPKLPTNVNLIRLLQTHFAVALRDVFATNLFPFIKPGHMGWKIPDRDLVRAAIEYALPQIRIIRPKLVICLGLRTFNALREACGQPSVYPLAAAIGSPFTFEGARIWCQAHTGGQGQAMRNAGGAKVPDDWARMKRDVAITL